MEALQIVQRDCSFLVATSFISAFVGDFGVGAKVDDEIDVARLARDQPVEILRQNRMIDLRDIFFWPWLTQQQMNRPSTKFLKL